MKQRPIPFFDPSVNAIRAGRKFQTRRIVKSKSKLLPPAEAINFHQVGKWFHFENTAETATEHDPNGKPYLKTWTFTCPYGEPSDRLWVRETWRVSPSACEGWSMDASEPCTGWIDYKAGGCAQKTAPNFDVLERAVFGKGEVDWDFLPDRWKPSIFMPRWASRILLEITKVRVERLNDISEQDAIAEGCISTAVVNEAGDDYTGLYAHEHFYELWDSIHGDGAWLENPWVWVIEFRVLQGGDQ